MFFNYQASSQVRSWEQSDARLKFWTQNSCCHFLPVLKRHAAKLKTGSTGSCDQLARVPLVLRGVLARVRDRTCERNSSQPVFMWPFSPVFFSLSYAGLRFTPLCRPLNTDWTRKSHFFRPVWPSFSSRLSPTRTCWWEMERQSRWINILPVFTTFLAAVYPSALLEKHTLFAAP